MAENSKEVVESVVNVEVKESKKSKPEKVKAVVCPNIEAVASVLVQYPHVHTVHVNEEGEWSFMPRPAFTAYTREEILNG